MAIWSNTALSAIETQFGRFDAEFYKPEFLDTDRSLSLIDGVKLRDVTSKIDVGHVGPMVRHYSEAGVLLLQTQNVREFFLDLGNSVRVTPEFHASLIKSQVHRGDILIARSGSFGSAAIYLEDSVINSADVIIVQIDDPRVNALYAVTFMNTWYGSAQLIRFASGGVQGHVNLRILEHFRIPILDEVEQECIAEIVQAAYVARMASAESYAAAQQLLESELGLDKLTFEKAVGYTTRFSELERTRRFDSEHFYPAFDNLKETLPKCVQMVRLASLLNFCQRGKQPIYSETGLPVLNSKHVLENKITLEDNRCAMPSMATDLRIQYGDVLLNGTGRGTIGRAAPYLVSEHQAIPDNHVTILRSLTLDPAFLSFFLNSLAGRLQVEKYQRGSSGQLELYPSDIRKFWVWEAPQSIQDEIRRLYDHATECSRESKKLLEQAKARVEQLIEEAAQP